MGGQYILYLRLFITLYHPINTVLTLIFPVDL